MLQIIKIVINLLCLIFLCGCKEISSNQNIVDNQNKYLKNFQLKLDSINLYNDTRQLKIWGTLINNSEKTLFFPIIENEPLVSYPGIDWEVIDNLNLTGLYIKWFKGDSLLLPNATVFPPEHFPPPSNGIFSWEDSIKAYSGKKRGWEVKNIIEVEKLKNKGKYFKKSYNWYFRRKKMLFDSPFILYPKSKKKISVVLNLTKLTENFHNRFSYELNDFVSKVDSIQLSIVSDSTVIKDSLFLHSDIESLRVNRIELFNGILESNKVPIVFIEN